MFAIFLSQLLRYNNHVYATKGYKYKLAINKCNKIVFSNYFINRVLL